MRDVLREEKKFLLNQAEALKLRNYLSNVVHTDSHNGPDGYQVRSLYFDSLSNRDLWRDFLNFPYFTSFSAH